MQRTPLRTLLILAFASLLAGCGGKTWVTPGRPALAPDQVKILYKYPAAYERLGTILHLHADGAPWNEGADATPIIEELLAQSGGMGANALLLLDDTTMADTSITMTYKGNPCKLPVIGKSRTIIAQAIFVTKE